MNKNYTLIHPKAPNVRLTMERAGKNYNIICQVFFNDTNAWEIMGQKLTNFEVGKTTPEQAAAYMLDVLDKFLAAHKMLMVLPKDVTDFMAMNYNQTSHQNNN